MKIKGKNRVVLFLVFIIIMFYVFIKFVYINYSPNLEFNDFYSGMVKSDQNELMNSIKLGVYNDRDYYELFNDLYFKFHELDSTNTWRCINNKETGECTFYNAVLSNDEKSCRELPNVRNVAYPGKYGTSYFDHYYRLSCVMNTRMLEKYNKEFDKIQFCKNFPETYIQQECLIYTCESYYWNKEKPGICTEGNIHSWFRGY